MATILCGVSGIEYHTEHMPISLTSRESHHPIFDIPAPKLLSLLPRWLEQELSDKENYLLYLALFKCTDLMEFRFPAKMAPSTAGTIAQNMLPLANIVETILDSSVARRDNILHLPTFVITPDTADLSDSHEWIKIWIQCYADYANHYKTATALEKLQRKESILERLIKDKTKDISLYAHQLANWAAQAASFDIHANYIVLNEYDKNELMSSYWRRIIIACARTESIWEIPDVDLQDLIEHCEEYIGHGSIYAHTLMSLLRSGAEKKKNFIDLGDIDLGLNGSATFRILDADTSIEDANKLAAIDSAPLIEPVEKHYPNKLAFLRARANWKMKQDYLNNNSPTTAINPLINNIIKGEDC